MLVNLWATWCAPCVKELPTIQKLEERHAVAGDLGIIVVSQDMAPKASVDAFLKSKGIAAAIVPRPGHEADRRAGHRGDADDRAL